MSKDLVFVSWRDQIHFMESNVCAGGLTDYEAARSEMWDGLYAKYGRDVEFAIEEIPASILSKFIVWVETPEDEDSE